MLRFSLFTLLAAILVISLGCAALVNASELWAEVVVTATVLGLLVATIRAIYLSERSRAFAGGFAIVGWAYLLLVQGPWLESVRPRLLTTVAVNRLQPLLDKDTVNNDASVGLALAWLARQQNTAATGSWNFPYPLTALRSSASPSSTSAFEEIGQCLWTILLACLGGFIARWFGGRRQKIQ